MNDQDISILYALERGIVIAFSEDPSLTDHVVRRAYEAAANRCRALAMGHEVKEAELDGPEAALYGSLVEVCARLASEGASDLETTAKGDPVSPEDLHRCMKKLVRSVEKATKRSGVRGYLNFVAKYVK